MSNAARNLRSHVSPDAARARTADCRRRLAGRLPAAVVLTLAFVIALQHQPKHAGRVARAVDQGSKRVAASSRPWTEPFAATLAPRSHSAGWPRSTSWPALARAAEHEALRPLQVR